MFYFAQLTHDSLGNILPRVAVIRQTTEYVDRKIVKVPTAVAFYDTLDDALAEARRLNAAVMCDA